jgi:hypothetical protein
LNGEYNGRKYIRRIICQEETQAEVEMMGGNASGG